MKKKVAFHTLGCKLNFVETSTLGKKFLENGFEIVDLNENPDIFILNTCSVTERANREARQIIRKSLRKSPNTFVAVTGCYAQLEPEQIASIDGVDIVLGAKEKLNFFEHVNSFQKNSVPKIFTSPVDEITDFNVAFSSEVGDRTRAFLKIQDGCDFNCTFCTIPLARGESRSQSIEECVKQAKYLADLGFREIVLTGVNVGDFGKKNNSSFLKLIQELDKVNGINRFRISSIEPNLLTKEIIDFVFESEKFCNHFHIPLQSGNDEILQLMRRRYTTTNYKKILEYIKTKDKTCGIGIDVIVGFPNETKEHFEETYKFLVELPATYLHIFTYSERPNTPAIQLENKVEPKIRFKRNEMLRNLNVKKKFNFYNDFIGKKMEILIESKLENGFYSGLTTNYIRVEFDATDDLINTIQTVEIEKISSEICKGKIV